MAITKEVLSEVVGKKLLGGLLTIVDSSFSDKEQRNGAKSLVRQRCQECLKELESHVDVEDGTATE